jgi:membrane protease YdiL (CAAX protease family)
VNDGPAWPAPPAAAEPSPEAASQVPAAPATPPGAAADPLSRYRALQVISILLIVGGLLTIFAVLVLSADLLFAGGNLEPRELGRALAALLAIVAGSVATIAGLVMNAVRAVVVRGALPASRYRGPSIVVLLLIATIIASFGALGAAGDLLALQSGGKLTVGGSLLVLTITQIGLVVTAVLFVVLPKALVGVGLLPERGAGRSVLLGLALAIPAWIGATLLGAVLDLILEQLHRRPEPGIVDVAVMRIDPTVLILALVVVAPVAEELFFRGVVYNAWLREYGPRVALFGSAALFAVIHANTESANALIGSVVNVVPIFGLGLVLATLYRATGSLAASIALHAGFNAISVTVALLVRAGILNIPLPS